MYVTNNLTASIYQSSLFYSTGNLHTDTFFPRIKDQNLALVLVNDSDEPFVPVNVNVSSQLQSQNTLQTATSTIINTASNRTNAARSYLNDAKSLVERLDALAEQAAEVGVSQTMRDQLDEEAQTLISELVDIYDNAAFNQELIAQGGTYTISAGLDGEQLTLNNANISLSYLGLDSFDLTTQSGAEAAETASADAIDNIDGQLTINTSNQNTLAAQQTINSSAVLAEADAVTNIENNAYAQTTLENARASIKAEVSLATGIQGTNLRVSVLENMVNGIINIGNLISNTQESAEETQADREDAANAAEAQQQLSEFENQISKDTIPYDVISSDSTDTKEPIYTPPQSTQKSTATLENMFNGIINISNLINPVPKATYKPSSQAAETELKQFESAISKDTIPLSIIEGGSNAEE